MSDISRLTCPLHVLEDHSAHVAPSFGLRDISTITQTYRAAAVDTAQYVTLLALVQATSKGSRRPIFSMRIHTQQHARSEHHTQLAKMSLDEIFDLAAAVYCNFLH